MNYRSFNFEQIWTLLSKLIQHCLEITTKVSSKQDPRQTGKAVTQYSYRIWVGQKITSISSELFHDTFDRHLQLQYNHDQPDNVNVDNKNIYQIHFVQLRYNSRLYDHILYILGNNSRYRVD